MVTGRGTPASINSPYRPLTEALLQLLRDHDLPSDAGIKPWLPALTGLLPGVIPGAEGGTDSSVAMSAAMRGEAVVQLLPRVAPTGLLVVLEVLAASQPPGRRRSAAGLAERSLALSVLRGALLDRLATGETDRATAAVRSHVVWLRA